MNDYFTGAINQLIVRCEHLIGMIPTGLPREFAVLEQISRQEIASVSDKLNQLLKNPELLKPESQVERLRGFKQAVRDIDILETVCIAALERKNDNDLFLNKVMELIRHEINYPLPPLVVTSLSKSKSYFETWTKYRLMLVPLGECRFLLHLPDIYHELGHPLLEEARDPKVKAFQAALFDVIEKVTEYIDEEMEKSERRNDPQTFQTYLELWIRCWIVGWAKEFFCDLFAVYILGPAYGWSHLHLSATRGIDPFSVPLFGRETRHPPDAARMSAILMGLAIAGFGVEASLIEQKWKELLEADEAKPSAEYTRCFPQKIIRFIAEKAYEGTQSLNCRLATTETNDPIHHLFNQAWTNFWLDPADYVDWEKATIDEIREKLLKSSSERRFIIRFDEFK